MVLDVASKRRAAVLALALLPTLSCGGPPIAGTPRPAGTSHSPISAAPEPMPTLNGHYQVVAGDPADTAPETWVFTPCGEGCATAEMGGEGSRRRATARYVDKQWIIDMHVGGAVQCGDGTSVPGTAHYSWNPDTLEGRYWSTADFSPCGTDNPLDSYPLPLKLTKDSP